MNFAKRATYDSVINAEKAYTSYKWTLGDWSTLHKDYCAGVESAEFVLATTLDTSTKCVLKFYSNEGVYSPIDKRHHKSTSKVRLEFRDEIQFKTVSVTASFMSVNDEKLATFNSHISNSGQQFVDVSFKSSLDGWSATKYLQNYSTLIIFVEIIITYPVQTSLADANVLDGSTDFIDQLAAIFDTKDFCDVTFNVGGKELRAHKLILASSSAVFRAMFTLEMKEKTGDTVHITDTDATAFEAFIRYLYTGRVNNLEEIVADLLVIADKYEVMKLKKICEKRMIDTLNIDTAIDCLLMANRYSCTDLEKKAVDFAKTNIHVLLGQVLTKLVGQPKLISQISNLEQPDCVSYFKSRTVP